MDIVVLAVHMNTNQSNIATYSGNNSSTSTTMDSGDNPTVISILFRNRASERIGCFQISNNLTSTILRVITINHVYKVSHYQIVVRPLVL
jgi:hypothetical protein